MMLFFAQRLDEIFFDYTLDTYKPPALNSVYLCREAIDLIDDIEEDLIDRQNLDRVLDELQWSLSLDTVVKILLSSPTEKYVLRGEGVKLLDTKIRLEVLERTLNPLVYLETCELEIIDALNAGEKKRTNELIRQYTSMLINHGVSKEHLKEKTDQYFFKGKELSAISDVAEYFELVSPTSHNFEIYFVVSNMITEVTRTIDSFGLSIIDEPPEPAKTLAKTVGLYPEAEEVWVEVKDVSAFDRFAARRLAESRLDMVRDLFLLFSHKNRINWRESALITQCCDETPVLVGKPKNTMEKGFDLRASDASKRLNKLIKYIGLTGSSFIKFHRAVDSHGIGTTNDLPENQLLNIWIALETLVPSHVHGGGKVVKIANGICPILLRNYLNRLVSRLSADLIRWNRPKISRLLRKIPDSKSNTLYERVFLLVSLPEFEHLRKKLYRQLDDFPLLRFRVYELSETFSSPKNIQNRIELHQQKVEWQLRRIYRTRNLIVHSGRSLTYIDALIENSHDYLDQALNAVVEKSCNMFDAQSLEQVFDSCSLEYQTYINNLKAMDKLTRDNALTLL